MAFRLYGIVAFFANATKMRLRRRKFSTGNKMTTRIKTPNFFIRQKPRHPTFLFAGPVPRSPSQADATSMLGESTDRSESAALIGTKTKTPNFFIRGARSPFPESKKPRHPTFLFARLVPRSPFPVPRSPFPESGGRDFDAGGLARSIGKRRLDQAFQAVKTKTLNLLIRKKDPRHSTS